jgi:hypothetical protein
MSVVKNIIIIFGYVILLSVSIFIFIRSRETGSQYRILQTEYNILQTNYANTFKQYQSATQYSIKLSEQLRLATNKLDNANEYAGYSIEYSTDIADGIRGAIELNERNWYIITNSYESNGRIYQR